MKNLALMLLLSAIAVVTSSCGGTTPPPDQTSQPGLTAGADKTKGDARLLGEAPPSDARFTIFCDVVRGPNHVALAAQLKEDLNRTSGLHAWHIIHADTQSTIFYGYYRTFSDDKADHAEYLRSQNELRAVEKLKNAQGDKLFARAIFLPINEPDPDAPPQWNLANVSANAYWSLQVGAYYDFPERKKYAVDQVRIMREKGYDAYYYHGETISSVCVGAYPRAAIKEQDADAARPATSDERVMVVAGQLPPNVDGKMVDQEGHPVVVESQKLEILSPALAQAVRDFPQHMINGEAHGIRTKAGNIVSDPSFIVLVPHADEHAANQNPDSANIGADRGANEATRAIVGNEPPSDFNSNNPPARSRYGHLNSVDQK